MSYILINHLKIEISSKTNERIQKMLLLKNVHNRSIHFNIKTDRNLLKLVNENLLCRLRKQHVMRVRRPLKGFVFLIKNKINTNT